MDKLLDQDTNAGILDDQSIGLPDWDNPSLAAFFDTLAQWQREGLIQEIDFTARLAGPGNANYQFGPLFAGARFDR